MALRRAGGAASVRRVSAAVGAESAGAVPALAEPLSPATSRAAVAATAAPTALWCRCRCRWDMGDLLGLGGEVPKP
ncbi:hypothetical protein SVIOM342S_00502 [Streptomyces violaceorubidus]